MSRTAHVDDEPEDDNVLSLSLADYTVACICPLGVECAAVEAMLDEIHDPLPTGRDRNAYTFGRLGPHNIIVAVMPETGNNTAATTATQLLNDFPSFRFGLLVGIGGGVPGSKESGNDVRLGDVVVSHATGTFGGVVQYDLGKKLFNGSFQRTGHLNKPPEVLSASAKRLQASHYRSPSKMTSYLAEMTGRFPKMQELFQHPGLDQDELFCSDYAHQGGSSCEECDREQTVPRPPRRDIDPRIHYGTIGSANMVLKDAVTRDQLKRDTGALCVEMEAAGLMDTFPCLVIRGICDYADSHKNKQWQPYAAATAAAYMKELLMMIPLQQVKQTAAARESTKAALEAVLNSIEGPVRKTEDQVQYMYKRQEETHEAEILSWVSEIPYQRHYKAALDGLLPGSGRWLFDNAEFAKWQASDRSGMFWLCGKPGAGKTKLCAMLVDTLTKKDDDVIYFFCSRNANDPGRQEPKAALRALVHQLALRARGGLPKKLCETFDKRYSTGMARNGMDFDEAHELLLGLLNGYARTTIVIDALDECSEEDRRSLIHSLRNLVDHSTALVRVFVSSRGDGDISARLQEVPHISVAESITRTDMERFVEQEIRDAIRYKDLLYGQVTPELEERVTAELLAKAGGMFQWVRLQVKLLCQMATKAQVLSQLGRLPPTLGQTYDQIYEKIEASPSAFEAHLALVWLMCAREPLRPTQWASAVSWAMNRKQKDTQSSRISAEALLGMCQNLVVYDEMQNYIAFSHISVREYLESKSQFDKLHLECVAAETSLRFLIRTRLPRPSEIEYGFYKYSAQHWISHVKATAELAPPELDEFLGPWQAPTMAYREWKGAIELFGRRYREYRYADEIVTLTNGLLLATHYGIRHTKLWNRSRHDPNATDERGLSLLALASRTGQQRIVKLLIRNGATVNPFRAEVDSRTAMCVYNPRHSNSSYIQVDDCHPLFLAIQGGHPEVAMMLLKAGATFGNVSVLSVATGYGPPDVLLHILEQDPSSRVSESELIMAAMNDSFSSTLKACLSACQDSTITGKAIETIFDHRTDRKDIVTQLLAHRITASVLIGMWRRKRLGILTSILEWVPDLPVSEAVVEELALDAGSHINCVVEVLRSLLPGASIDSKTLRAVFRVRFGAVELLKVLLTSKDCRRLGGETKMSTNSKAITADSAPLQQLFNENIHVRPTEDLLLAALGNREEALELSKLLLGKKPETTSITASVVEKAVVNEKHGVELVELLLSIGCPISITRAAAAAESNKVCGIKIIELLLSKGRDMGNSSKDSQEDVELDRLQESMLHLKLGHLKQGAVSGAPQTSPASRQQLSSGQIEGAGKWGVSEADVSAAIQGCKTSVESLENLVTQCSPLPITQAILEKAAMNRYKSVEIFRLLLANNPNLAAYDEPVLQTAVRNPSQAYELTKLLLETADTVPISWKLILAIEQNMYAGPKILQMLLDSPKTTVGVPVVCTAAAAGQENLFCELLARADTESIKREYRSIFTAAFDSGSLDVLGRCIDYGGVWDGTDEDGWNAGLMAYHAQDKALISRIRRMIGHRPATPLPPSAWENAKSGFVVTVVGSTMEIKGNNTTDILVRANHPMIPTSTSYFEIQIIQLDEPEYYSANDQASLAIGVIDKNRTYIPAYYTDTGYVHDLFLMSERRGFTQGDTVGFGVDWARKEQFVTVNGVRENAYMSFEQLYARRMFPFVRLFAGAGRCMLKTKFQEPFVYQLLS